MKIFLSATALVLATTAAQALTVTDPLINEFRPNPPGADPTTSTIELIGKAGEAFTGWIVSLEGDRTGGEVERAEEVSGTFGADGLLTVDVRDLENPSFTLILTSLFTGAIGDKIDSDDDGTLDNLGVFGTILDAIGVIDATSDSDTVFGAQLGGTDLAFIGSEPRLVFRDSTVGDLFAISDPDRGRVFDANGIDVTPDFFDTDPTAGIGTFGAENPGVAAIPLPAGLPLLLAGLGGLALTRRRS